MNFDSINNFETASSNTRARARGPLGMMSQLLNRSGASANSGNSNISAGSGHRHHAHGQGHGHGRGGVGAASPRHHNQSDQTPKPTKLTAEYAAGSYLPPGLSGPSSFSFSPPTDRIDCNDTSTNHRKSRSRYLSFVSSHHNSIRSHFHAASQAQSFNIHSNSPARSNFTMSTNQSSLPITPNSSLQSITTSGGERRLCVIDLDPFWKCVDQDDAKISEQQMKDKQIAESVTNSKSTTAASDNSQMKSKKRNGMYDDDHEREYTAANAMNYEYIGIHNDLPNQFHSNSTNTNIDQKDQRPMESSRELDGEMKEIRDDCGSSEFVSRSIGLANAASSAPQISGNDNKGDESISNDSPTTLQLPINDSNILTDHHVTSLLNMTLPLDRQINSAVSNDSYKSPAPQNRKHYHHQQQNFSHNHSIIEGDGESNLSLEERLRRERQRLHSSGITQFAWGLLNRSDIDGTEGTAKAQITNSSMYTSISRNDCDQQQTLRPLPENLHSPRSIKKKLFAIEDNSCSMRESSKMLRILVPIRGNIYIQDGVGQNAQEPLRLLYDKSMLDEKSISRNQHYVSKESRSKCNRTNTTKYNERKSSINRKGRKKRHRNRATGSVVGRDAGAIDPQLSPDGTMVAFVVAGEIYVMSCDPPLVNDDDDNSTEYKFDNDSNNNCDDKWNSDNENFPKMDVDKGFDGEQSTAINDNRDFKGSRKPVRITFGAMTIDQDEKEYNDDLYSTSSSEDENSDDGNTMEVPSTQRQERSNDKKLYGRFITHGLADFVAQEEMDRYRGFWWDTESRGILFARVDESCIPSYRITHQGKDSSTGDEDHRYPFAGEANPDVILGYVTVDRKSILGRNGCFGDRAEKDEDNKPCGNMNGKDFINKEDISCKQTLLTPIRNRTISTKRASNVGSKALSNWDKVKWFTPPSDASEYLARVSWFPDGTASVQWQNRAQSILLLIRINVQTGETITLHREQSDIWINLHHMLRVLPRAIHPDECYRSDEHQKEALLLPEGSFSFLFASERTGYFHLYLYTYVAGDSSATLLRAVSAGDWMVESIAGVDMENDVVYVTGTYNSPLERHLYALPLINANGKLGEGSELLEGQGGAKSVRRGLKQVINTLSGAGVIPKTSRRKNVNVFSNLIHPPTIGSTPPDPICLTVDPGMHNIVMDESCRLVVDTSSDLSRPTSTRVFCLPVGGPLFPVGGSALSNVDDSQERHPLSMDKADYNGAFHKVEKKNAHGLKLLFVLYDASLDTNSSIPGSLKSGASANTVFGVPAPELISFPTSDGSEVLHAALFRPDPNLHGPGPYPLICAVYGGPHVQRVNRSWSQCADMRAQRMCSQGFAVVKCDNRGSARRGLAFEGSIKNRLGRLEVLDQVTAVRQLAMRGIADTKRVGIYGWSYGGYLAAMCLCRAPDVFHVAVAGAPVTSWDGYDTHYTERYMGLPSENASGYNESAVFEHVPNMRGKLMIVHGLIDENVHFRHTARLINRLIAAGKEYDLLIFPDERHSPRKARDRIYMEKRISNYFLKNLLSNDLRPIPGDGANVGIRPIAGYL